MEIMKKVWEKPRLTVLVRSRPEEAVLNGCKIGGFGPLTQTLDNADCYDIPGCIPCATISST
jgi:hypothetical protein